MGVKRRIDGKLRSQGKNECVTIRRRSCSELHADVAICAAAVIDDELLAQFRGKPLGQRARNEVRAPTRRIRNDQPDGLARVVIAECRWSSGE
jgi:hypothetical protein